MKPLQNRGDAMVMVGWILTVAGAIGLAVAGGSLVAPDYESVRATAERLARIPPYFAGGGIAFAAGIQLLAAGAIVRAIVEAAERALPPTVPAPDTASTQTADGWPRMPE